MLLKNELDVSSARESKQSYTVDRLPLPSSLHPVLLLLLFFATAVILQIPSGAYHAEFGAYPDEPAHYVTSLMVREYVVEFKPVSPLAFAENYYAHYPKVAIGHWPPLLYLIQALWMLVFSQARAVILLELAATTAVLAYSVYSEARRWFGSTAALLAGLLLISLPIIQAYTDEEMSETLLVLMCFWSTIFFARYMDSERWQDSLWFGVFFSLAVLTKGSGWLLAIVPPVALLLTRKLRLVFRRSFWVSVLTVGVLCIPWQLMTMQMAERGWTGGSQPNIAYTVSALGELLGLLWRILGPVLAVLCAIGVLVSILRKHVSSRAAALFALLFADWIFHAIVPAGVEDRKMIIAVPALVMFVFAGGFWVADRLPIQGSLARWRSAVVVIFAGLAFFLQTFTIPREKHYGYIEAARFITSDSRLRGATILVSSKSVGEGLLVSEMAMRKPRPERTVIRATKALAQVDWNGSHYRALFTTPQQILEYLDQHRIDLVVIDNLAGENTFSHHELLRRTIDQSGRFQPIATFRSENSIRDGEVQLYRFNKR